MPNHVKHIVTLRGPLAAVTELRAAIRNAVNDEPGYPCLIDFEKILPMPEDIAKGDLAMGSADDLSGKNWYRWSIDNWGTKWNAYSQTSRSARRLLFQTAWSHPRPILKKLSAMFPELTLEVRYADEDRGRNCARIDYRAGKAVLIEDKDGDLDFVGRVWRAK